MSLQPTRTGASLAASWLVAAGLILVTAHSSLAADPTAPGRMWAAIDVGRAPMPATAPGLSESGTAWLFDVSIGIAVSPKVLLGAEKGSWMIASSWPSATRGAGIETLFVTARVYPLKNSALHVRLGGGLMLGWDESAPGSNAERLGWEAGVGYDLRLGGHHHLTPFVLFCSGHVGTMGANLNILTIGAGYTYR